MGKLAQMRKDALLAELTATRRQILEAVSRLPAKMRPLSALEGGASVLDTLARLAGWDDANRQAVDAVLAGQLPDFYAYAERGWATFNEKLAREYAIADFDALKARVLQTQQALLAVVSGVPAEEMERDYGVRFKKTKVTIDRLLRAQLQDEKALLRQIRPLSALTPKIPGG